MSILRRHSLSKCYGSVLAVMLIAGASSISSAMAVGLVSTGVSGNVGYTYRSSSYSSGSYNNQQMLNANINNTFFIWRDWFITGNSNLSFTQNETSVKRGGGESSSLTGSLGFTVLPQSSTPFGFSYTRSDSRVNSALKGVSRNSPSLDDNVVTDSLAMHQSLIGKGYRLKLKYSNDQFSSELRGKYGANSLGLSGLLRGKTGVLRASVTQRNARTYQGLERDSRVVGLNHNYTGFKQAAINSSLSASNIKQSPALSSGGGSIEYSTALLQASTGLVWRSLNKKLTVTSRLRFSEIKNTTANSLKPLVNTSFLVSLGVAYRFTKNVHVSVNATRSQSKSSGSEIASSSEQLGVAYNSDVIKLSDWSYDWRARANMGQRESRGKKSTTTSFGAGHGLARKWRFLRSQHVYLRGGQDVSVNSQSNQTRQRLSHRASLGWRQSGSGVSRNAQLQLSDQRDMSEDSVMQMFSANIDQQTTLTRRIKLSGSLNYQLTNYQYVDSLGGVSSSSNTSTASLTGALSYLNPFSIAGMAFTSDYRYSQSMVAQDTSSVQHALNNKLNYRVGKIDVSLQYLYREARKISYNVVYFNVRRVF